MLVALQLVGVVAVPLNLTVLLPWVEPKLDPVIVTDAPTAPDVGERLVILGAGTTVKLTPLLALLETVTTTLPVVAPDGTVATMLVALQLVVLALVPLNLTVLVPLVEPKFVPVIVTEAPTAPEVGDKFVILGPAARVSTGDRNDKAITIRRIGFQLRTRIGTSLLGSSVGARNDPVTRLGSLLPVKTLGTFFPRMQTHLSGICKAGWEPIAKSSRRAALWQRILLGVNSTYLRLMSISCEKESSRGRSRKSVSV